MPSVAPNLCWRCHRAKPCLCAAKRDRKRGTPAQRGYDSLHRQLRVIVLRRDPVCKICNRAPSTVSEHIVPIEQGGATTLDNLQGACATCANRKTVTKDGGRRTWGSRYV